MLQRWSHAHENKQFLESFHLNTGVFNVLDFMSIILQDINFLKSKHDNNTVDGEHLAISTVGANKANLRTNINCIKYASRIISRVCYKGQYEENAEIAIKMASTVLNDYRDDTDRNTGLDIILRFNDDFDPNDVTENEEGTSTIAPSIELNVIKEVRFPIVVVPASLSVLSLSSSSLSSSSSNQRNFSKFIRFGASSTM